MAERILQGSFDVLRGLIAEGWARDAAKPSAVVDVAVLVDGKRIATGRADRFRADLKAAGIGEGCHGFLIELPEELCDGRAHNLSIMVETASSPLAGSPKTLGPMTSIEVVAAKHAFLLADFHSIEQKLVKQSCADAG